MENEGRGSALEGFVELMSITTRHESKEDADRVILKELKKAAKKPRKKPGMSLLMVVGADKLGTRHQRLRYQAEVICHKYDLKLFDLLGGGVERRLMKARAELYCVARSFRMSYPQIGRMFNRDHSSIMSALRTWGGAEYEKYKGGRIDFGGIRLIDCILPEERVDILEPEPADVRDVQG